MEILPGIPGRGPAGQRRSTELRMNKSTREGGQSRGYHHIWQRFHPGLTQKRLLENQREMIKTSRLWIRRLSFFSTLTFPLPHFPSSLSSLFFFYSFSLSFFIFLASSLVRYSSRPRLPHYLPPTLFSSRPFPVSPPSLLFFLVLELHRSPSTWSLELI